jgi:hypothetical protein
MIRNLENNSSLYHIWFLMTVCWMVFLLDCPTGSNENATEPSGHDVNLSDTARAGLGDSAPRFLFAEYECCSDKPLSKQIDEMINFTRLISIAHVTPKSVISICLKYRL